MTVKELIEELLKHDMSLQVLLINGNDLMWPSQFTETVVKKLWAATPPKLYDVQYDDGDSNHYFLPNSLLIHWT